MGISKTAALTARDLFWQNLEQQGTQHMIWSTNTWKSEKQMSASIGKPLQCPFTKHIMQLLTTRAWYGRGSEAFELRFRSLLHAPAADECSIRKGWTIDVDSRSPAALRRRRPSACLWCREGDWSHCRARRHLKRTSVNFWLAWRGLSPFFPLVYWAERQALTVIGANW